MNQNMRTPTKDVLLKIDGPDGYRTMAGLRLKRLVVDGEEQSLSAITVPDAPKRILLAGAGVFRDSAADAEVRNHFFNGSVRTWEALIPGVGTITAPFQIASLEYRSDHLGDITFDMTLESIGVGFFQPMESSHV
jgi:predicted secreted protein